ncbi:MAG: hypothetical protein ACI9XB_005271, partial [Gammaproteobacteria bacterium]
YTLSIKPEFSIKKIQALIFYEVKHQILQKTLEESTLHSPRAADRGSQKKQKISYLSITQKIISRFLWWKRLYKSLSLRSF